MSTNNSKSKAAFVQQCVTLIAGVNSLPEPTYTLDGKVYAKADVLAPLQACVTTSARTPPAKAAFHQAVIDEKAAIVAARAMVTILKPFLKVRLGKQNPALQSQFGVPPEKVPQTPVLTKAAAVVKRKATRTALHTMGPKQKKAAKGTITPPPAPPTPSK